MLLLVMLACSKQALMGPIYEYQYNAMKKAEPVRLSPIPSPASPTVKILHVRVYTDQGYRRELMNWQRQVESLFSKVNFLLGEAYQLRLEVNSVSEWTSSSDASSMSAMLAELKALDKGEGASWVIGFVTQLPIVSTGVDTLGVTNYLGKHIVLRGSNNAAGLRASHRRFDRLDSAKVAELNQRLRLHQELFVFIHELGHTLGALHTSDEGLMSPHYDSSISWFVEANDDLVRVAISHRLDDSLGGAALTTALKDSMDEADSRGWNQRDIDKAWGKWASMGPQTGGLGKSLADEKNPLARQDDTEVETAWSMAQRYAQEGNEKQERKLLGAIRKYYRERKLVSGSAGPVSRYELAERYYRLGFFVAAEELLSSNSDKPENAAILAAIAQKRQRYGVLAGSTSEDREAEVFALIPK
ncbi:MAG: hypothetical protein JKY56_18560, partial [Kofleriaceae bacterium]|nr:hypothetical protein [Kofleriaceae bacterium]